MPPPGYGTLKQDDIAIRLQTSTLQLTVLPLDEHVLRLLASDAWSALHQLVSTRDSIIEETARAAGYADPSLFLVMLFGLDQETTFNPDDLTLESRNQFFRPIGVVPITPHWGSHHLNQRETAIAIFLFEPDIAVWEPMTVSFGSASSNQWERTLRRLDQERANALARAGTAPSDTSERR